jgi:hypothetical protein
MNQCPKRYSSKIALNAHLRRYHKKSEMSND